MFAFHFLRHFSKISEPYSRVDTPFSGCSKKIALVSARDLCVSDRARISNPRSLHTVMVTLESPPQFHASLPPGHLLRGVPAATGGDLRVRGRILRLETLVGI